MRFTFFNQSTFFLFGIMIFFLLLQACGSGADDNTEQQLITGNPEIDALTDQLKSDPNNAFLYAKRGAVFYEFEGYEQAIKDLNRAIQLDSLQPDFYHLLADTYLDYFKSKEALETLEKANEVFPNRIPTLLKLAEFQMILKQHGTSIQTAQQILSFSPANPEAYYMMGVNYKIMGDTAKAIGMFQNAIDQNPDLIDGFVQLGILMDRQKKDQLAEQYFETALRIDSTQVAALFAKAMFHTKRKQDNKALNLYKKINKIDPQYPLAYYNAGLIYLEYDSLTTAYGLFNIATQVEPTFGEAYYYKGLASEKMGKREQAINDYRQALNFEGDFNAKAEEGLIRLRAK